MSTQDSNQDSLNLPDVDDYFSQYNLEEDQGAGQSADDYFSQYNLDDEPQTFSEAFGQGVDQLQGMLYSSVEWAGETFNSKDLDAWGEAGRLRNVSEADAYGKGMSIYDIEDIGDFGQWSKETAARLLPMMGMTIGGAAAVSVAAPVVGLTATVGGVIGAFVPSLAMGVGQIQQAFKERGEEHEAGAWALVGGTAIAALDTILPAKIGSALVKKFGQEAAEEIAKKTLMRNVSLEAIKSGATEGATEAIQGVISEVAAAYGTDTAMDEDLGWNMLEEAAAGALMGVLTGGLAGGVSTKRARQQVKDAAPKPIADATADVSAPKPLNSRDGDDASPLNNQMMSDGRDLEDAAVAGKLGDPLDLAPTVTATETPIVTEPTQQADPDYTEWQRVKDRETEEFTDTEMRRINGKDEYRKYKAPEQAKPATVVADEAAPIAEPKDPEIQHIEDMVAKSKAKAAKKDVKKAEFADIMPLLRKIRDEGGVQIGSPLHGELTSTAGLTNKSLVGLFRHEPNPKSTNIAADGTPMFSPDLDTYPLSEFREEFGVEPESNGKDDDSLVDRQWILNRISDRSLGQKTDIDTQILEDFERELHESGAEVTDTPEYILASIKKSAIDRKEFDALTPDERQERFVIEGNELIEEAKQDGTFNAEYFDDTEIDEAVAYESFIQRTGQGEAAKSVVPDDRQGQAAAEVTAEPEVAPTLEVAAPEAVAEKPEVPRETKPSKLKTLVDTVREKKKLEAEPAKPKAVLKPTQVEEDLFGGPTIEEERAATQRKTEGPKRAEKEQKPADEGLFDVEGRKQVDLVDEAKAKPVEKIEEATSFEKTKDGNLIAYKVMPIDDSGEVISGADSRQKFGVLKSGDTIEMVGDGVFVGATPEYVMDFYSGLAENEVLVKVEADINNIKTGQTALSDREPEPSFSKVKVVSVNQVTKDGEVIEEKFQIDREFENDLLKPKGETLSIGDEKVLFDSNDLKVFEDDRFGGPRRSVRYVKYEDGRPIGVLQVGFRGRRTKKGVIQNVFVVKDKRREKIAANLLKRAREDYDIKHSTDLTNAGKAFKSADGVKYKLGAALKDGDVLTPTGQAVDTDAVTKALEKQLKAAGLSDKITLNVVDEIRSAITGLEVDANGKFVTKKTDSGVERVIEVALNAEDPAFTMNHEIIHAMKNLGLFLPAEWTALTKAAQADTNLMERVNREWEGQNLTEAQLQEEAIAEMYGEWSEGKAQRGFVAKAFDKIKQLILSIKSAFTSQGLHNVETVFSDVAGGRVGGRDGAAADAVTDVSVLYQSAWHGTAHTFDKFTLAHMGSGEGAQAYGWGLYFAEDKNIAEWYKGKLGKRALIIDGVEIGQPSDYGVDINHRAAAAQFIDKEADTTSLPAYFIPSIATAQIIGSSSGLNFEQTMWNAADSAVGREHPQFTETLKRITEWGNKNKATLDKIKIERTGKLYKVDLVPTKDELLHWQEDIIGRNAEMDAKIKEIEADIDPWWIDNIGDEHNIFIDDLKGFMFYKVVGQALIDDAISLDADSKAYQAIINGDSHQAASLYLNDMGIKGITYYDANSRIRGAKKDKTNNFVIFDEALIEIEERFQKKQKSPIGGDLLNNDFSKANPAVLDYLTAEHLGWYDRIRMAKSKEALSQTLDNFRFKFQDTMIPVLRLQEAIKGAGGKVSEAIDTYLKETVMTSRIGSQLGRLNEEVKIPFFKELAGKKITEEEMEAYLYARHAKERNKSMSELNPAIEEGTGSGMTDAQADIIMKEIEASGKKPDLEYFAAKLDKVLDDSLQARIDGGLISEEEGIAYRDRWKYYVPLRGKSEIDPMFENELPRPRKGKGIDVKGREFKQAFGRKSEARDILAYIFMQAEESIIRVENNEVAKSFYNMAVANPNPDIWTTKKITMRPFIDKKTGKVKYRAESRIAAEDADHTITAKVNGKERRVILNRENAVAMKVADSMRNLSQQEMNGFVKATAWLNRYLSMINTSLNPEFVISNAFRDLQLGIVAAGEEGVADMKKKVIKDYKNALVAAEKGAFGKYDGEWGKWYREWEAQGGRVFFNQVDDIKRMRDQNKKIMKDAMTGKSISKAIRGTLDIIQKVNLGVESAIRLAAYKNLREAGMSKLKAAAASKELTVNFNRKGVYGPVINSLYLFANAAIQGNVKVLRFTTTKTGQKAIAGVVVLGALVEIASQMISGEDDDGEKFHNKIPEYEKSRNWIITYGTGRGDYIKIPAPYGLNVFSHIGRGIVEIASGSKKPSQAALEMITTMMDSFNPIGGSFDLSEPEDIASLLAPTALDLPLDLGFNRDFTGRSIMPEQSPYGPPIPDSQLKWGSVSPFFDSITQWANRVTGGSAVESGLIDVSPETLEYIFGFGTGGAGNFVKRLYDLPQKLTDPSREFEARDIPFVRKFAGQDNLWYDRSQFYERLKVIELYKSQIDGYREARDIKSARALHEKRRNELSMADMSKDTRKKLSVIRKKKIGLNERLEKGVMSKDDYGKRMDAIKKREQELVVRFNKRYNQRVLGY